MERAIGNLYNSVFKQNVEKAQLLREYPVSAGVMAMTRVLEEARDGIRSYSKGAPEAIFKMCKLSASETNKYLEVAKGMAEQGLRVLGVAQGQCSDDNLPQAQQDLELRFLGLIGLQDPIRPEVPAAIQECMEAGIKVIMITGDFPETARCIAKQIGLDAQKSIITGDEMKVLSDEELKNKIQNTNIFARVIPEQKLRIVKALQANNEIVAMTGDGVNDAPALKAANIGIAMGNKGTDVAREASSLVLLDDNFASIVAAIRSGRRIFDNLQKAMSYIIAIHIPIIGLTLLPAFILSLPILLLPLHIVFMELIIDPVCSIAFESEQEEKGIMNRPPRDPNMQFFGKEKILASVMHGLIVLFTVVAVYFLSLDEGHTDGEVRAIAFTSLIAGNIMLILTSLSKSRSFLSVFREKNLAALFILFAALIMLFLIISVPSLQNIFSFEFPGYAHFIPSIVGTLFILTSLEIVKFYRNSVNR
jgi:Ca2+-transporting ATPase